MKRIVVLRRAAVEELARARRWYDDRRAGVGDELVACVDAVIQQAVIAPETCARVHREVRRVLVRRFPYGVFFLAEDDRIVVLAIFHAHRDPAVWKRRR